MVTVNVYLHNLISGSPKSNKTNMSQSSKGRLIKQRFNLKEQELALDNICESQELEFQNNDQMPESYDVGGTLEETELYIENDKNGHIVHSIVSLFGYDGIDLYTAVKYAKYQHQLEYQKCTTLMMDMPDYAQFFVKHGLAIEKAVRKTYKNFNIKNYLKSIQLVHCSDVIFLFFYFSFDIFFVLLFGVHL